MDELFDGLLIDHDVQGGRWWWWWRRRRRYRMLLLLLTVVAVFVNFRWFFDGRDAR